MTKDSKNEPVWVTQKHINDHIKSFGEVWVRFPSGHETTVVSVPDGQLMSKEKTVKENPADAVAAVLFGIGLAMGTLPIAVASLILKHNLFTECFSRMDAFWRPVSGNNSHWNPI